MPHQAPDQRLLEADQAAVLWRLVAAFGAAQVTVTSVQPTSQPHLAQTPADRQPTLPGEAS